MLLSFYKKMTLKSQNDAPVRKQSLHYFSYLSGRLAPWPGQDAFFGWGKTPFVPQTVTAEPSLYEISFKNQMKKHFFVIILFLQKK